jgi:NAD(P) transhydrogenase subunit alpha
VKKFIALGASVAVEKGAGVSASVSDAEYEAAGRERWHAAAATVKDADIVLGVQGPDPKALKGLVLRRMDCRRARSLRAAQAKSMTMPLRR